MKRALAKSLSSPTQLRTAQLDSPIGKLLIVTTTSHLVALEFGDMEERMDKYLRSRFGEIDLHASDDPLNVVSRLEAYLAGDLTGLDDIPVDAKGTEFQQAVWRELRRIRVGETISYVELARRLGSAGASRAVGMANSKNPIGIVVPCHRVIAADGTLSGYAGGVERKRWLLEHEQARRQMGLGF